MPIIMQVVICSIAGGLLSLLGGILLLASKKRATFAEYATAFAAGALLASAFLDVLPESLENSNVNSVMIFVLIGFIVFFVLEVVLGWFHGHGSNKSSENQLSSAAPMLVIGDTLHNFIDGIAIATGFLVSPETGIIVTLAVAAHEIPQEIGDFGILYHGGFSRKKVILVNIISSLATVVAAVGFYILGSNLEISFAPFLGLVAGFFIYIAASDIIPTIHSDKKRSAKIKKVIMVVVGVLTVGLAMMALHDFAHVHSHDHHEHHDHTHIEDYHTEDMDHVH